MTRRKTDGERISTWVFNCGYDEIRLAARIDRLVRRRMAEAWDLGRTYGINDIASDANPYRRRKEP